MYACFSCYSNILDTLADSPWLIEKLPLDFHLGICYDCPIILGGCSYVRISCFIVPAVVSGLKETDQLYLRLASIGLVDGGMAGLVWIYFVAWVGFSFVNVSMAEMGSM